MSPCVCVCECVHVGVRLRYRARTNTHTTDQIGQQQLLHVRIADQAVSELEALVVKVKASLPAFAHQDQLHRVARGLDLQGPRSLGHLRGP